MVLTESDSFRKNHNKMLYTACFFDKQANLYLLSKRKGKLLEKEVRNLHMTLQYKPQEVNENLIGERIKVSLIGYANDGNNEGFLVSACSENKELQSLIDNLSVPHITTSTSCHGKSVNTSFLEFEPIERFEIIGVFGCCVSDSPS